MNDFKLILFDKYLIRADEYCWILAVIKRNKEPIVPKIKKYKNNSNTEYSLINDFSNFVDKAYYGSFTDALRGIKDRELKESDIDTIDDLIQRLNQIDNQITKVRKKFL